MIALASPLMMAWQQGLHAADDVVVRNEGAPPTVINVLANDAGAGESLTLFDFTQPQFGALTRSGNSVVYTAVPIANRLIERDAFTYTMQTPSGSDSAVVYVDLRNLPPVANVDAINVNRNQFVTFDPRVNDSDPGGDPLTITGISTPPIGVGSFTPSSVYFKPPAGFSGQTSFTYTVADGEGGTDTATINVSVSTTNRAPIAQDDPYGSVSWGQTVTYDVRLNDMDADGDPITVISVGPKNPNVGIAGVINGGTGVTYRAPNSPFLGEVSFTYTISDGQGGTATATFSVVVDNGV